MLLLAGTYLAVINGSEQQLDFPLLETRWSASESDHDCGSIFAVLLLRLGEFTGLLQRDFSNNYADSCFGGANAIGAMSRTGWLSDAYRVTS